MTKQSNIRNFSIIAHIDHGKSTLADRLLEKCHAVPEREMENQLLDNMDLERERGITIKARAVRLTYHAQDGEDYELNLIDTPGHVDFNYEVSRSLAACEGAVLVVDASQGVEAQTLANTYMALEHDLELVPILNKIDLPSAHPDEVAQEVEDVIGLPCMDAPRVSAKTGLNVDQVLERVVSDIPAPTGDPDAPLKALIFDSIYDSYKGVIVYIRVFEGSVKPGDTIRMMATGAEFTLVEVGHMGATSLTPCAQLQAGEVGYLTASIKTVQDTRVGDTVTLAERPTAEALPGYRQVKPMVFCGIYPADGAKYPDLKDALEKLQLNDASLTFELETSAALGFGFRCGFLGLLHMEIITERLEREFDLDIITTTPSVRYRLTLTDGTVEMIDNPSSYPDPSNIVKQEEPFVDVHLYTPNDYVGGLMDLCQSKRGVLIDMKYLDDVRVDLHYALPLGEIVYDFFDAIKSRSRGYASYDYEFKEYRESDLVKLDFLLNGDPVDARLITTDVEEVRLDVSIRRVKDLRLTYNLIPGGGADADNTTVQLSAETIRVSGSEAALENLGDTLSIGTINLADITKNTSVTFGISLPDGITNLTGVTEVTADISFHGLSIKELTVTDIQSINIPEGLSVELITEKLTVTLRGPTGLISKVTPEDLLVTVDFTGAEVGTSTFRATVSLSGEYSALGTVKTEPVSAKIDAE